MAENRTQELLKSYSLLEIMQSVTSVINRHYEGRTFWVRCELVKMSLHQASGHCYLELADKNETTIVAQMKGIIWADKFKQILSKFRSTTQSELASGMKVLLQCSVSFHAVHGMSLFVTDIEPSFTMGEMAKMKADTIRRLQQENLFRKNKELQIGVLPQRIAVISVASSRGYHDFITTIVHTKKHYALQLTLFEATLQGENAVPTLLAAFKKIKADIQNFDAVTIIRGGAGDTSLACYDEYLLAKAVAEFPLPVITGIGHATNETVTEMVAWKNCITPTAAADFFLNNFETQDRLITDLAERIKRECTQQFEEKNLETRKLAKEFQKNCRSSMHRAGDNLKTMIDWLNVFSLRKIADEKKILNYSTDSVRHVPGRNLQQFHQQKIMQLSVQLGLLAQQHYREAGHRISQLFTGLRSAESTVVNSGLQLNHFEEKIKILDPQNTLLRGFSITRKNGKAITQPDQLKQGDLLETTLAEGIVRSVVDKK